MTMTLRKWPDLHSFTYFIVTFAFVFVIAANCVSSGGDEPFYGWPLIAYWSRKPFGANSGIDLVRSMHWESLGLAVNFLVALAIMCSVAVFTEWQFRFRGKSGDRWFQFRIWTLLVFTISASFFLGMNLKAWHFGSEFVDQGWPYTFKRFGTFVSGLSPEGVYSYRNLVLDAGIGFWGVFALTMICELICSWRVARPVQKHRPTESEAGDGKDGAKE